MLAAESSGGAPTNHGTGGNVEKLFQRGGRGYNSVGEARVWRDVWLKQPPGGERGQQIRSAAGRAFPQAGHLATYGWGGTVGAKFEPDIAWGVRGGARTPRQLPHVL
jgi:hypothetical protein